MSSIQLRKIEASEDIREHTYDVTVDLTVTAMSIPEALDRVLGRLGLES